jgi:hypothetical protein
MRVDDKVTLRPRVDFSGDKRPTAEDVDTLRHEAHAACYIANSIKTEIAIEGQAAAWKPSATELYVNRICTSLPSSLRIA